MPVRVSDNSDRIKAAAVAGVNAGLTAAALVLQGRIKRNFGSEGGRVIGKTHTGKNIYGAAPVGRFPGVRTGRLRQSIYAAPATKGVAKVGTNVRYGRFVDRARPWLRRSAQLAAPAMRQAFAQKSSEVIAALVGRGGGR